MQVLDNRLDAMPKDLLNLVHDTLGGTQAYWHERYSLVIAPLAQSAHNWKTIPHKNYVFTFRYFFHEKFPELHCPRPDTVWSRHARVMGEINYEQQRPPRPTCHTLSLEELLDVVLQHVEHEGVIITVAQVIRAAVTGENESTLCSRLLDELAEFDAHHPVLELLYEKWGEYNEENDDEDDAWLYEPAGWETESDYVRCLTPQRYVNDDVPCVCPGCGAAGTN